MFKFKKLTAIVLTFAMVCMLAACGDNKKEPDKNDPTPTGSQSKTEDLTKASSGEAPDTKEIEENYKKADGFKKGYANFSAKLLADCYKGETMMVSPLSLYAALGMLSNGASGETLKELEEAFGCDVNEVAKAILYITLRSERADVVKIANSIWINDTEDFNVKDAFLSACGRYYRSAVKKAPFSNPQTLKDLNDWVNEKTKGRIDKILDRIPENIVMILLNAMTFDGKWMSQFEEDYTEKDGTFVKADGSKKTVEMMHGDAERYFEDEDMTGVEKDYKDGYFLRAYLPKEGKSVSDILTKLTKNGTVSYVNADEIYLSMPKFESETTLTLNDTLKAMGVKKAFLEGEADFSAMTDMSVYVSQVLQKTYIKVDEHGTEAAAVTAILVANECYIPEKVVKSVVLDRPFVYEIVDAESGVTLFAGVYEG